MFTCHLRKVFLLFLLLPSFTLLVFNFLFVHVFIAGINIDNLDIFFKLHMESGRRKHIYIIIRFYNIHNKHHFLQMHQFVRWRKLTTFPFGSFHSLRAHILKRTTTTMSVVCARVGSCAAFGRTFAYNARRAICARKCSKRGEVTTSMRHYKCAK